MCRFRSGRAAFLSLDRPEPVSAHRRTRIFRSFSPWPRLCSLLLPGNKDGHLSPGCVWIDLRGGHLIRQERKPMAAGAMNPVDGVTSARSRRNVQNRGGAAGARHCLRSSSTYRHPQERAEVFFLKVSRSGSRLRPPWLQAAVLHTSIRGPKSPRQSPKWLNSP